MNKFSSYNGLDAIDHPVIAVRNMDASKRIYEKLGFTVPPRGSHVEWGTGNWCIMFPEDYIELRGIINPERFLMGLDTHLEKFGDGLMGVAFATTDALASHDLMVANGLKVKAVQSLTRNFELPTGWTQPKFRLYAPDSSQVEGLMHVVVIEHETPSLTRKPEYLSHLNGCIGVADMYGVVDNLDQVEQAQKKLLGNKSVNRDSAGIHVTLPNEQKIHLLKENVIRTKFGAALPKHFKILPCLVALITR